MTVPQLDKGFVERPSLPGYVLENVWSEQNYSAIYNGRRKEDKLSVLVKLARDARFNIETGWLERDYDISQLLTSASAAKPFALQQSHCGPSLIYADKGFQSLESLAEAGIVDLELALTLGIAVADAVSALHKEHLVHCNLNPGNIWWNATEQEALISDFSCALHPSSQDAVPAFARQLLDIRYISPECTGRLTRAPDQRSDIYSLGIILFQILTGRVPFEEQNPLNIIDSHIATQAKFSEKECQDIHVQLRRVVLKALAKSPEERFSTAKGLSADLLECLSQWRSSGTIEEFQIGRRDPSGRLHISDQVYGRDREISILVDKFRQTQNSPPAMLLVCGSPGIGKSTLLNQLKKIIHKDGGRFILGKFDQYRRNIPYFSLAQAIQQLINQLLCEPDEELDVWRSRIKAAVGKNNQLVIDVIPELKALLDPIPQKDQAGNQDVASNKEASPLPPAQARNRFNRVFSRLIQSLAPPDEPLCIVFDDLQWADPASLQLISHILINSDAKNLFFVGAYRDQEVNDGHPLDLTIRKLKESDADIQLLPLVELREHEILRIVKDTFGARDSESRQLAQVLYGRTEGNPFYVKQLLHFMSDERLIEFDYCDGIWRWDPTRIQQQGVTQDVVDLLNARLKSLTEQDRLTLATAACIGSQFNADKVAIATSYRLDAVMKRLDKAVQLGLIANNTIESPQQFRFLHDRIQQAALNSVTDNEKKVFRFKIGKRLLDALKVDEANDPQPEILSNLNHAWDLIEEADKYRVAHLNLIAGGKARQTLAYADALRYLEIGIALLRADAWHTDYSLAFELHSEAFECAYLVGDRNHADEFYAVLIRNAQSKLDKARTYITNIILKDNEESYEEALKVGIEALTLFGIRYSKHPSRGQLLVELMAVQLRMRGREPHDLMSTKELEDPEKIAALKILVTLFPTAYFLSPDLLMYTGLKVVNFSLRDGISPLSACGFVLYGLGLGAGMNNWGKGYKFARFALDLAEKHKDPQILCKVLVIFSEFIKFWWQDDIDDSFPLIERARKLAIEVGDHQYANYAIIGGISMHFSRGFRLEDFLQYCHNYSRFVSHSKDAFANESLLMWQNCAQALQGKTNEPYSLDNDSYDENESEARFRRPGGNVTLLSYQLVLRLQLAYLFGRYDDALVLANKSEKVISSAPGYITVADHYLYRGLTAVALIRQSRNKRKYRLILRDCKSKLHQFAKNSPLNFLQHETLLKADAAQARGQFSDALKGYECTVEQAGPRGFIQLVGLANERAAAACLDNNQTKLASWYLGHARAAYEEWGADAKVASLYGTYSNLVDDIPTERGAVSTRTAADVDAPQTDSFDFEAALRAAKILDSKGHSENLLSELTGVIRIQLGAEVAQLLVWEGDKVRAEASAVTNGYNDTAIPKRLPSKLYSSAIVNYVKHTGDELVLSNPVLDPRFVRCPYLNERHPKSVVCVGVRHQGTFLGVLYMEHSQIIDVFSRQKLRWLKVLAAEVGQAVWNARLGHYKNYVHKFAPATVSKEIDANPERPDLAIKRRNVSILFADVAGYTHITELMEESQLATFMNQMFAQFSDEIHHYNGEILEFAGDELFVLFSDDDPTKHTWNAAKTAIAIRRLSERLSVKTPSEEIPIVMNMGINSGVASVGLHAVESSAGARWRLGVSGTVVNVAARVRELASNGEILISAECAQRLPDEFVLEEAGTHSLKNMKEPVQIFTLRKEREPRAGKGASEYEHQH